MWLSYVKIAFRSLVKQRLYSFINVSGLAIGVTTCILILMYVRYENSYDEFHPKAKQIYRLNLEGKLGDNDFSMALSAPISGPTMQEEYPEVLSYTRIRNSGFPVLRYEDKVFSEEHFWNADSNIFEMFDIPMLAGDPKTALTQPLSLVLTEKMARKYFGDEDPIGKVLNSDNRVDFTVTGVVRELPPNSHWHFDFLSSMVTYGDSRQTIWVNNNFTTYIELQEGSDYKQLEDKFLDLVRKYVGPQVQQFLGISFDQLLERGDAYRIYLTPLVDIHLYSQLDNEVGINGDGETVKIFVYIAIFILLLATINYMNLATARSMNRAREIGIRKTLGSSRGQLILQFLAESIFVTFLSFAVAILLVKIALPWFSNLMDSQLTLSISDIPSILLWVIPVGLLAGSYPAFMLSSFNPVKVLKGNKSVGKGGDWFRNGLVIFQFSVSIILLIGTMIIRGQLDFIQTKDLGLNPENLVIIEKTDDIGRSMQGFKAMLLDNPGALMVSNSTMIPGNPDGVNGSVFAMAKDEGELSLLLASFWVDHDYADAFDLEMEEGRFYSRDWTTDTNAVIMNAAAVKAFGITDPLGKDLITFFGPNAGERLPLNIIGVVEDYHFESPQKEIRPMCMFLMSDGNSRNRANWGKFVTVKYDPAQLSSTLDHVETSWKQFAGDQALEYEHFDELYAEMFRSERQAANVVTVFAVLAIFIAALGLLGLASFTAQKRTKEIGIRKVLGASVSSILLLLSKETLKLMLLSIVIAIPLAYYAMQAWLQNFAYRAEVSIFIYINAALIAIVVALITVTWQSNRAATADPVKSIRYE